MADNSELERLYDAHANALYGYLLNLTRNVADTHDLVQEVFCRLARQPRITASARDERAFLIGMAHNAFVDAARRGASRRRRHESLARGTTGLFASASDPDDATFRQEIEAALAELPPEQRAVVHLRLWEQLTFDEIAEIMHIPLHTAASRYRYGLNKIRDRLRPLYEELK